MWLLSGRSPIESSILPLLKHTCGGKQLAAVLVIYTTKGVTPEVNVREHISHKSSPSVNKAAPEETSPEVWNRGISGTKNWHVSTNNLIKKNDIEVGCKPLACQPYVLHIEQVWTCLGVPVQWGSMSKGFYTTY